MTDAEGPGDDRPGRPRREDEDEFVHSHTRAEGQDTSREAAHRAYIGGPQVRSLILLQLADGPMIDEELEDALAPIVDSTVCARRADLVRDGVVTKLRDEDGKVVKRRNRRGNNCIVWRLVEKDEVVIPEPRRTRRADPPPEPPSPADAAPGVRSVLIQVTSADGRVHTAHAKLQGGIVGAAVSSSGFYASELDWLAQRVANGWLCGYDCDHCIDASEEMDG